MMSLSVVVRNPRSKQNNFRVRILILVLTSFLCGCSGAGGTLEKKKILQLSAEQKHDRVSNALADFVWTRSSDPELLIIYCASKFTVSNQDSTCALGEGSKPQVVAFSDALWKTWSGHTVDARTVFTSLLRDNESALWGELGLLELATYTNNHRELASLLGRFEKILSNRDPIYRRLYEHYRIAHAEDTSDWAGLQKLLSKYSREQILNEPVLFSAQSRVLFVKGQRLQMAELLRTARSNIRGTTLYMLSKADYAVLEEGIGASKAAIRKLAASHPEDQRLALELAYIDIYQSSASVTSAGLKKLNNFARLSPNNVRLLLSMAVTLASYHKSDDSAQIFRLIDSRRTNLNDFALFHILSAWDAVYWGNIDQARKSLGEALEMAPRHVAANWLKVLIAKRRDDPRAGAEALAPLMESDPYNENYISLVMYFRDKFNTADFERLATQATRHKADQE